MINKNVALSFGSLLPDGWQLDKAATSQKKHAQALRLSVRTICTKALWTLPLRLDVGFDHTRNRNAPCLFFRTFNITPGYAGWVMLRAIDVRLCHKFLLKTIAKWFNGKINPNQAQRRTRALCQLKFGFDGSWTMDYMYAFIEMILIEAKPSPKQITEATTVMHELLDSRFDEWNRAPTLP